MSINVEKPPLFWVALRLTYLTERLALGSTSGSLTVDDQLAEMLSMSEALVRIGGLVKAEPLVNHRMQLLVRQELIQSAVLLHGAHTNAMDAGIFELQWSDVCLSSKACQDPDLSDLPARRDGID